MNWQYNKIQQLYEEAAKMRWALRSIQRWLSQLDNDDIERESDLYLDMINGVLDDDDQDDSIDLLSGGSFNISDCGSISADDAGTTRSIPREPTDIGRRGSE